jgi:quercetin dioxygenase-like cupin family protein
MTTRALIAPLSFYVASLAAVAALAFAQGRKSQPAGETVRLENERVRVLEYVLQPGVPMGVHGHPRDRVEITLSGSRVRVTANGKTTEADEKEGAITWSKGSSEIHNVVNIGKTPLRAIHVELK